MHHVIMGLNKHPAGGIRAVGRRLHTGTGHFWVGGVHDAMRSKEQRIFLHKTVKRSPIYILFTTYISQTHAA